MTNEKRMVIPIIANDEEGENETHTDNEEKSSIKLGLIFLGAGFILLLVTLQALTFQDTNPEGFHLLADFYIPWAPIFLMAGTAGSFILATGTLLLIGREGIGLWIYKFLRKLKKGNNSSK